MFFIFNSTQIFLFFLKISAPRHSIQNTIASCTTSLSSFYDNDIDSGKDDMHSPNMGRR